MVREMTGDIWSCNIHGHLLYKTQNGFNNFSFLVSFVETTYRIVVLVCISRVFGRIYHPIPLHFWHIYFLASREELIRFWGHGGLYIVE